MRYARIIKRTEADLLRGRGPSLQAARQGIAGARSGCESGAPCRSRRVIESPRRTRPSNRLTGACAGRSARPSGPRTNGRSLASARQRAAEAARWRRCGFAAPSRAGSNRGHAGSSMWWTNQVARAWPAGTLGGHPGSGGEAFIIGQRDDGTVIFAITAFSRPVAKAAGTARGRLWRYSLREARCGPGRRPGYPDPIAGPG
jgi:hypothetical protein